MTETTDRRLTVLFRSGSVMLLLFTLGAWFTLNLFHQYVQDCDAAKVFYHAAQIAENGTFAIPGWKYLTTGEWDCATLFAIPIYGLTGNILLSFGIANCLNILLFGAACFLVLKKMGVRFPIVCLMLSILLLPWSWGMLAYSNMLFYGAGQYIYRVIVPLLLIGLYEGGVCSIARGLKVFLCAVLIGMTFAVASSSGVYVLACGIVPVLICRMVYALSKDMKGIRRSNVLLTLSVVIAALAGVFVHKMLEMTTPLDGMNLITLDALFPAIAKSVDDLLRLMQLFPLETTSAFTVTALGHLMKLGLFGIILLSALSRYRLAFGFEAAFGETKQANSLISAELISIALWNFLVCTLSTSAGRYHLIGMIPFIISAGGTIEDLLCRRASIWLRHVGSFALCGLVFCLFGYLWNQARHIINENRNYVSFAVIETAEEQNVGTVIYLDDSALMEEAEALDLTRKYGNYVSKMDQLRIFNDYDRKEERSTYDERHLLVVTEAASIGHLSEHLRPQYTLVKNLGNGYSIYVSDHNRLDGSIGPGKMAGTTMDFPHSYGYRSSDTYDAQGMLSLKDGFLNSPDFIADANGTVVTIIAKDLVGVPVIRIVENGAERSMSLSEENRSFQIQPGAAFRFSIVASPEVEVTIDRIEFTNLHPAFPI